MAERFSLKDHLFNEETVADAARDFARGIDGFDPDAYLRAVLAGFPSRELLARLDWMADCFEPYLPIEFSAMADALEASMPPPLDPGREDGDFGRFIHAVPGVLAVRHGLDHHHPRALDLLHAATQRFSMEFYIRPFLDRWPEDTLAQLHLWAEDANYHVRRLVSEGTRPKLPWARAVTLRPDQTLPLLSKLHADPTRYVTRSVANHLNDLSKSDPDLVIGTLEDWRAQGRQDPREADWMRRHALRSAVKAGHPRALATLGFDPDAPLSARLRVAPTAQIGATLDFDLTLTAPARTPVLVDYILHFPPGSGRKDKVHKLKQAVIPKGASLTLTKSHRLKGDATTFRLIPGPHRLSVQINGRIRATRPFALIA